MLTIAIFEILSVTAKLSKESSYIYNSRFSKFMGLNPINSLLFEFAVLEKQLNKFSIGF